MMMTEKNSSKTRPICVCSTLSPVGKKRRSGVIYTFTYVREDSFFADIISHVLRSSSVLTQKQKQKCWSLCFSNQMIN